MSQSTNKVTVNHSKNLVWDSTLKAIKEAQNSSKLKIHTLDQENGIITGSLGMSFTSWGETITITVNSLEAQKTEIILNSKSHLALIDWGKNQNNLNKLIQHLTIELKKIGQPQD